MIIKISNIIFFLNLVLHHFQDYFSSYETGQSVDGRKRYNSRAWLDSQLAGAGLEPTPDTMLR